MVGVVASTAEARERLCARWPGRREQINKLLGLLGEPHDHALPVFVHGPHVTGKSSIVRDVFTTLGRPFAYTSLVDSHTPRLLLDAILEELQPHLEGLTEKHTRCDRLADLVSLLAKGLPADGPAVYLVIDEATRLLDWKGTDHLLPALMKLSELTGAPHDRLRHARSNPIPLDDDAGRLPSPDVSPRLPSLALDSSANYPTPPTRRSKRRHDPRGEARMGRVPIRRGGSSAPPRVIRLVHQSAAAGHPPLRASRGCERESLPQLRRVRPPAVHGDV